MKSSGFCSEIFHNKLGANLRKKYLEWTEQRFWWNFIKINFPVPKRCNFDKIFKIFFQPLGLGKRKISWKCFFIQNLKTINFMNLVAIKVESKSNQVRVLFEKSTRFPKQTRLWFERDSNKSGFLGKFFDGMRL